MYTVITKFERPDASIPYYIDTNPQLKAEFKTFVENCFSFVWAGTLITVTEESELIEVTRVTYADQETLMHFLSWLDAAFPTFFADRDAYCAANNIIITRSIETS